MGFRSSVCVAFHAGSAKVLKLQLMCCRCRGMGGRGGIATKQAPAAAEDSDAARKRFGNAKSISSSQYNSEDTGSRNDYEKEVR